MSSIIKSDFKLWLLCLVVLWTLVVGLSSVWNIYQVNKNLFESFKREATTCIEKDQVLRSWISFHGGVYVPITAETRPNPYLIFMSDRDVTTLGGLRLTLLNPGYVTRQMSELFPNLKAPIGHIVSLDPKRDAAKPDKWEENALKQFEKGADRIYEVTYINGAPYMRMIIPLKAEGFCMKCHALDGYSSGEIIGGLSVKIPMREAMAEADAQSLSLVIWHVLIWAAGVAGITLYFKRQSEYLQKRQKVENALRDSERHYRELVSLSPQPIAVYTEGRIVFANKAALQVIGAKSQEEVLGRSIFEFTHPDYRQQIIERLDRLSKGERLDVSEMKLISLDGQEKFIKINSVAIRYLGRPSIMSIFEDITEWKEAQEAQKRLVTAVEQAADAVTITDPSGKIQYVNPAFEKMTGYSENEALGKPIFMLDGYDQETYQKIYKVLAEEKPWQGHILAKRKDGTNIEIEAAISPVKTPDNKVVNYVAVYHDVTEEAILRAQLLQAQKMEAIGTLAGGVAHDFNNLLTAIQGYVELSFLKLDPSDPIYKNLVQIHKTTIRAADLVRQLLLFSRRQPLDTLPLNLNQVVTEIKKMLKRILGEDIEIKSELEPQLWSIQADAGNIEQVLMNLAVNARDAMDKGGTLVIRTRNVEIENDYCKTVPYARAGRFVCLSVSDTGHGMDKNLIQHIFEPFFTTKEIGKGTGLGLSVVYGIVKQHQGWINVYSEPGIGSEFKIYLPASSKTPESRSHEPGIPEGLKGRGQTVLLVEDEEGVREVASSALKENGYKVIEAESATRALEIFKKEKDVLDLVLCDVVLPDESGIDLVDKMLSLCPDIPIVMTSGYTDHRSQWPLIQERGHVFLPKPYTIKDLLLSLKEALGKNRSWPSS